MSSWKVGINLYRFIVGVYKKWHVAIDECDLYLVYHELEFEGHLEGC